MAGWATAVNTGIAVSAAANAAAAHLMDVDGDGIEDLVYPDTTTGHWVVLFGTPAGGFLPSVVDTGIPETIGFAKYALALDYNGDGRSDLMVPTTTGWQILESTGSRTADAIFTIITTNGLSSLSGLKNSANGKPIYENSVWAVDFSNRGLSDVVYTDGTNFYLLRNGGPTNNYVFQPQTTVYSDSSFYNGLSPSYVDAQLDFDGSGRGGLLIASVPVSNTSDLAALVSNETPAYYPMENVFNPIDAVINTQVSSPLPMDSNGDGLTDFAYVPHGGTYWTIAIEMGAALTTAPPFINLTSNVAGTIVSDPIVADYYGDGRQELIVQPTAGTWDIINSVYSATGLGTATSSLSTAPYPTNYASGTLRVGSIEANGFNDLVYANENGAGTLWTWHYNLHNTNTNNSAPDLVTSITDAFGNVSQFQYDSLTSGYTAPGMGNPIYSVGSGAQYPIRDFDSSMQVVSVYTGSDGTGNNYTQTYAYMFAKFDTQGRGFLGFGDIFSKDSRYGTGDILGYNTSFPWTGMVTSESVYKQSDGNTIRQISHNTPDDLIYGTGYATRYFPFFDSVVSKNNDDENGVSTPLNQTTTTLNASTSNGSGDRTSSSFDAYGNVTSQQTSTIDYATNQNFTSTTTTVFATPNTSDYCVDLPQQVTVTRTSAAGALSRIVTTPSGDLDTTYCRVNSTTVSSGENDAPPLTTRYTYDNTPGNALNPAPYGNVVETDVSGPGLLTTRTTQYDYAGGNDEFPTSQTSAVSNLVSQATWRYDLGVKSADIDVNENQTSYTYDGLGRVILITHPDKSETEFTYSSKCGCNSGGNPAAYSVLTTQIPSGGTGIYTDDTIYDVMARPLTQLKMLLGGAISYVYRTYDSAGHVIGVSRPTFSTSYAYGTSGYQTDYTYDDALNRVTKIVQPKNASDTVPASYGDVTTVTYGLVSGIGFARRRAAPSHGVTQTTAKYTDALGETVQALDANNGTTIYTYDAFGDLTGTTDADTNANTKSTSITYDGLGHKTGMTDLNMGTWTYQVDALGEVTCQTDADGQSIIMAYDGIGRVTGKNETTPGGGCTPSSGDISLTDTWTYDQPGALGLLASVFDNSATGFQRTYAYDGFERPSDVTTTLGSTSVLHIHQL